MYNSSYDKKEIRNPDYRVFDYISEFYQHDFVCLDLGCGNGRKLIDLAPLINMYYAIDINESRIQSASTFCKSLPNVIFGVCDNYYLPFESAYFDLVSCFMSKNNIYEVTRVLKSGGYFIWETSGANDKRELKVAFGKDDLGFRGRLLNTNSETYTQFLIEQLNKYFSLKKFHRVCYNN